MTTYRITASAVHHGTRIDTSTAEYLGEAFQVEFQTAAEAERVAEELRGSVAEYGLDPTTEYDVEEVQP